MIRRPSVWLSLEEWSPPLNIHLPFLGSEDTTQRYQPPPPNFLCCHGHPRKDTEDHWPATSSILLINVFLRGSFDFCFRLCLRNILVWFFLHYVLPLAGSLHLHLCTRASQETQCKLSSSFNCIFISIAVLLSPVHRNTAALRLVKQQQEKGAQEDQLAMKRACFSTLVKEWQHFMKFSCKSTTFFDCCTYINVFVRCFLSSRQGVKVSGDRPCLGVRPIVNGSAGPFKWETYKQVHQRVLNFGSGLLHSCELKAVSITLGFMFCCILCI